MRAVAERAFIEEATQPMLFSGDPVDDMEMAKELIARHPHVDLKPLITIAGNRNQPTSARIAAIYTLGFIDDHGESASTLSQLIKDHHESPEIKDHAAEALEYILGHH